MQVKKQQVEPYMEQLTGSKLRMEYDKSVYCHPLYLTHTQNTLCKMPDLMNYKLESRLPGERSKTSVMQMILLEWKKVKSLLVKVKKNDIHSCHFTANRRGKSGSSDRFPLLGL